MRLAPARAAGRIAWRGARRNPRRSALVVFMVAFPVMLVTGVATIARTSLSTPAEAALWEAVSFVGGAFALFATGLISAAAFVVGARRQLRELGLVGAIGGDRRHVRAVVLLGGTSLGFVGSVAGAALGIAAAFALHPFFDDFVDHSVGPVRVNVLALLGAVVMGTAAATLAALAPARAAARLSTVDALAGRSAPPRPPGRVAGFGLLIVAAGVVLTVLGTETDYDIFQAGGLIAMLSGFLFSIPLLVGFVGRIASRLPMTGRLAARDAARHGRRTGAAVAAAVIALSVPIATSAYSYSREAYETSRSDAEEERNLPDYALGRAVVTGASLPVALVVVAVASALVASETRRSREILVSAGADPMFHRKLVGATSAVLALMAAVLAVPAGLMPVVALWASQDPGPDRLPLVIPWVTIATVVFVVPLVAGLVSGAVARQPKMGTLLRPAT